MKTEKILSGLLGRISPFAAVWSSRISSAATSVQTAGAFEDVRMRMVTLLSVLMTLMAMVVMIRMIVMLKMLVASSSS